MSQNPNLITINEVLIKFVAPRQLKRDLHLLAEERHISLSSLLRLLASEYVKRNHTA